MKAHWKKYTLNFKKPGGTSRGVLHTKDSWFLIVEDGERKGIGECGLLKGLSADDRPDYEDRLDWICKNINRDFREQYPYLKEFPSIQFGLEMALADLKAKDHVLFTSAFTENKDLQPINGLIWMGGKRYMREQVAERLRSGFRVLKMKIGAIDVDQEMEIVKDLRKEFSKEDLELRVDANGAFSAGEVPEVLDKLSRLDIHSIEQPIARGQWQEMAALCENTPLPIALDEELIGLFEEDERERMIKTIRPQYLILKPSFIGGWKGSRHWIDLAEKYGAEWWVTSALESNIGLNAIAQWNYTLKNPIASGLGTGSLYTNNFDSPLYIHNGAIGYDNRKEWRIWF